MTVDEIELRSSEQLIASYRVRAIIDPSIAGALYLTTERVILLSTPPTRGSGVPQLYSLSLGDIIQTATGTRGITTTATFTSSEPIGGTAGEHEETLAVAHANAIRESLLRNPFIDPEGHSLGVMFERNDSPVASDIVGRVATLRRGADSQAMQAAAMTSSIRVAPDERVVWRSESHGPTGLLRLLTRTGTARMYLTNFRFVSETGVPPRLKTREVFVDRIRSIRWSNSGPQLGTLIVEPNGPAPFNFEVARLLAGRKVIGHGGTLEYNTLPWKLFEAIGDDSDRMLSQLHGNSNVRSRKKEPEEILLSSLKISSPRSYFGRSRAELPELGARLVALRQALGEESFRDEAPDVPVRFASEEQVRWSVRRDGGRGDAFEVWLTNYRLILRCGNQKWWGLAEFFLDGSLRVNSLPWGNRKSVVVIGWDDVPVHRNELRSVTDTTGWWEKPYASLGWMPSRAVLAFRHDGPLVIPMESRDGESLAERLSSELIRLGSGADLGQQERIAQSPTALGGTLSVERSALDAAELEGTLIRSFPVRIGHANGRAATVKVTTTRVQLVEQETNQEDHRNVLWQAPVREFRQFIRFASNSATTMVMVTANPVLLDARRADKRMLGDFVDFTGRFPVVSCAPQESQELSALCVGLMEGGSGDLEESVGRASRPFCLWVGEEICKTYCLGEGCFVWLTTNRFIFYRPGLESITWECFLKDIEGVQQERLEGRPADITHLLATGAISVPLALSFPSVMSVIGLALIGFEYLVVARKKETRSWLIPVTKSGWTDRMSSELGPRLGVTVGPPRVSSASTNRIEKALWSMSIPASGPDGERMWRTLGIDMINIRERGRDSPSANIAADNDETLSDDGPSATSDSKVLREWEVRGGGSARAVRTRISLTARDLSVCENLGGRGWNVERVWRTAITRGTRLSAIEIRSRVGGPMRRGSGCMTVLLLALCIVAAVVVLNVLIPDRDLRLGVYGGIAFVAGLWVLLNRGLDSRLAVDRAKRTSAIAVMPHEWSRPVPRATPPLFRMRVSLGMTKDSDKVESGTIGHRWLDPLRPFVFAWGLRKPIPPIQCAPVFPVEAQVAAAVTKEVNAALDKIRAGEMV